MYGGNITTPNFKVTASGVANLVLAAGVSTLNGFPFKYTSGPKMTNTESGAKEYDGNEEYFTNGSGTRFTLAKTLTASATLDFGATAHNASTDLTITVTGAAVGDRVALSVPTAAQSAKGVFVAFVSAANTVIVRFWNLSGTDGEDPASGSFGVSVIRVGN